MKMTNIQTHIKKYCAHRIFLNLQNWKIKGHIIKLKSFQDALFHLRKIIEFELQEFQRISLKNDVITSPFKNSYALKLQISVLVKLKVGKL